MVERTAMIVGAGIGGLAAAIALRQAGWRVQVFERAEAPRELGFALSLAPNAMAALRELGLAERLLAEGHLPASVEIRRTDGRVLRHLQVPAQAAGSTVTPAVIALRPVLHGALLDAVGPEALVLGSEATGFAIGRGRTTLVLADGRTIAGDVIIGADGVGSAIRRCLRPADPPPRRSGYVAIRGVAHDAAHLLGDLSAISYQGPGVEAAVARASRSAVYWFMSLLASDVGAAPSSATAVLARFATSMDPLFTSVVRSTRVEDLRLDELFDRDPIDQWGAGVVTLLGDAAHPMLPHAGQGAAQALEDAVSLGMALRTGSDIAASLRKYERVRSARTGKIVNSARRIAKITTTRNAAIGWLRTAAVRLLPRRAMLDAFLLEGQPDPYRQLR
ncbi:MAG: FAD-dependent monooxygenase [Acidobacteriota bacterium]